MAKLHQGLNSHDRLKVRQGATQLRHHPRTKRPQRGEERRPSFHRMAPEGGLCIRGFDLIMKPLNIWPSPRGRTMGAVGLWMRSLSAG